MPRQWRETIEELTGSGTIRDRTGNTSPVEYTLVARQQVRERPRLGGAPLAPGRGTIEISGTFILDPPRGGLDLNEALVLTIADGSALEILVTVSGDPRQPFPFVVSHAGAFGDRYEQSA